MKNIMFSSLAFTLLSCAAAPERAIIHSTSKYTAGADASGTSDDPSAEVKHDPSSENEEGAGSANTNPSSALPLPSVPTNTPTDPASTPVVVTSKDIKKVNILVFSKTSGFRHDGSIKSGLAFMKASSEKNGFKYEATEDAAKLTKEYLAKFDAVFFLCTTGDIFTPAQQNVFENYIKAGGGYFGVHSATDTEYDWPWYGKLVGAFFDGHEVFESKVIRNDKTHVSTAALPDEWKITDEWYRFKSFDKDQVKVLLTLDDSPNTNPNVPHTSHPIAWYHEFEGGRAWYSGLGHFDFVWTNPLFEKHLFGGLLYASGVTNVTP